MTSRSLFAYGLLTTTLIACGGAGESAPAKSASPREEAAPPPEPRTVEEAQEQIKLAAASLDNNTKAGASTDSAAPKTPTPSGGSNTNVKSESTGQQNYTDTCANPCRALASMRRAVDALCRMTGDTDNRCVDAKKTLADNVGKTSSCKCSGS